MKLFSIIIPVYNIQSYIGKCIDSILNQTYNSYEVIVVDDGSIDNSYSISLKYSNDYNNITVYSKKNGGVSSARNYGMKYATGKYILFLDGDDYLSINALETYANILITDEYDLIVCSKNVLIGSEMKYEPHVLLKFNNNVNLSILELIFKSDSFSGALWQYLFKRNLLEKDGIKFNSNYINAEDADFLFKYLLKKRTYLISDEPLVVYREMRDGSTTHSMSEKAISSALKVIEKWYKYYIDNKVARIYFSHQYCKIVYQMGSCGYDCQFIERSVNKEIIRQSEGVKYILLRIVWKIFGYKNGSKIVSIIK